MNGWLISDRRGGDKDGEGRSIWERGWRGVGKEGMEGLSWWCGGEDWHEGVMEGRKEGWNARGSGKSRRSLKIISWW